MEIDYRHAYVLSQHQRRIWRMNNCSVLGLRSSFAGLTISTAATRRSLAFKVEDRDIRRHIVLESRHRR